MIKGKELREQWNAIEIIILELSLRNAGLFGSNTWGLYNITETIYNCSTRPT